MKIGRMFNELKFEEYYAIIDNHKKYSDFNTLGIYRSLIENQNLTLEQKILLRDYCNKYFQKTFDFFQIKDPFTYAKVVSLGLEMTDGDKENLWNKIKENQYKILKDKRIRHQNFGVYSKHMCGFDDCCLNGLMIQQGSILSEDQMCLHPSRYTKRVKSEKRKSDRKKQSKIIDHELNLEE